LRLFRERLMPVIVSMAAQIAATAMADFVERI